MKDQNLLSLNKCYENIKNLNKTLNAVVFLEPFEKVSRVTCSGSLESMPILIKDNICSKGMPTTAGSEILRDFVSPYDATLVRLLKEQGAIVFGKTNLDEFGMGSRTDRSIFGQTYNPVFKNYSCGGSSGGSAVAVASQFCQVSIGTDTGGSVRQPSAFCEVFGFKPTYGAISRFGMISYASSLDQAGIIARHMDDLRAVAEVIIQEDRQDSTSVSLVSPPSEVVNCYGVPIEFIKKHVTDEIWQVFSSWLEKAPFKWKSVSLKNCDEAVAVYYIIASSEASSNLSRYDGIRFGKHQVGEGLNSIDRFRSESFGIEVQKRILMGTYALSAGNLNAYFLQAAKLRRLIFNSLKDSLLGIDGLIFPVFPQRPLESNMEIGDIETYNTDIFNVLANLGGLPALSIPVKDKNRDYPFSYQIVGAPGSDFSLLEAAKAFV